MIGRRCGHQSGQDKRSEQDLFFGIILFRLASIGALKICSNIAYPSRYKSWQEQTCLGFENQMHRFSTETPAARLFSRK